MKATRETHYWELLQELLNNQFSRLPENAPAIIRFLS
jgi:hypothetical protein